jgi:carboxyl-terminal processing protease
MNKLRNKDSKPYKGITEVTLGTTVIGCLITLIIGFYVGVNWDSIFSKFKPYLGFKTSTAESIDMKPVQNLYASLKDNYDGTVDKEALIEGAKKGMIEAVGDKYTEYMTASEASDYQNSLAGDINEAGIGISFAKRDNYLRVLRTLPDNPARRAGILAGDIIYKIDGKEVWKEDADTVSQKLRGVAGSKVKLTIVRDNKEKTFELTREKINNVSADISYKDNIAILSVYRFSKDTGTLVKKLAEEAVNKKVKGVIVDLRNNGGGYVSAAQTMLSLWLDGEKVLSQKSRISGESNLYATRGSAILSNTKTVVLINGSTASASEIVVGALRDYKKATIVGEKSYGKGVVQSLVNFNDGALLKVTSAHWYTPNGDGINETGITPDIEVERTYEQINKSIDPQLDKAKSLLK